MVYEVLAVRVLVVLRYMCGVRGVGSQEQTQGLFNRLANHL